MTTLFDLPQPSHKAMAGFDGKTAIITGASSGLGEQFARSLSDAGARVILAARRIEKLNTLAAELNNAKAIQMDVSDKQSVKSRFVELEQAGEKIDICVNNAGIVVSTPIFEEDNEGDFESVIQTNLMGMRYVMKAVANHMKRHNIHGSIINIGSVCGANKPRADLAAYCASKAAVIQMTKALVGELSPHHIRINCISPGLVATPLIEHRLNNPQYKEAMEKTIPLGFIANPQDLEGALLLLASNAYSAYMTGTCITVDGGVSWGGKA